ncbi:MAG TPA: serine protease [Anaerolineales bacterium]|nr:serine protease [Anaerolineales bacterium]
MDTHSQSQITENVRLQNLRDFTVQIRNADNQIVGTGIAVSTDGKIVTCAHVIETALGVHPRYAKDTEVGVYFPQVHGEEVMKKRRATVLKWSVEYDDDIVLLQLTGGLSPLAPEQIAVLGTMDKSMGNLFNTYGYSPIGNYPAARGEGKILGSVQPPLDRNLQVDPVQLKSRDIASGMSGAAVLDITRNLIVGLVAERYYPEGSVQDDVAFGVDSKVLTFSPFDFELYEEAHALKPAPKPKLAEKFLKNIKWIAKQAIQERSHAKRFME